MTENTKNDITDQLQAQVKQAIGDNTPLYIQGGNSKLFYGNDVLNDKIDNINPSILDVSSHTGVINYDPSELCITVRAGTKLSELEGLLAQNNQIFAFEPPHYIFNGKDTATIGGAIASGISGPRRAYTGSVRDAILGVQIINGTGEIARFGGEVMKNVAGYDLSRMLVRSQGTLGVILDVSVRVIPKPDADMTLAFEATQAEALSYFQDLRKKLLPVSATSWLDGIVAVRLSASEQVLKSCKAKIRGDEQQDSDVFWQSIRDHSHEFFNEDKPLWRFSFPPNTPEISQLEDKPLLEWGGAQRWINSNTPVNIIRHIAESNKGYATLFNSKSIQKNTAGIDIFPKLEPALYTLHERLKKQMDPKGIFNPNRIYRGL